MPKENETEKVSKEEVKDLVSEITVLKAAASLLQIDRTVMDIQSVMIEGLIERLAKYEDVSEDKEYAQKLSNIINTKKEEDNGYAE